MKKLLALLAVVLAVVSCQREPEGLDVNVGGEQTVTVSVTIPEAETRAANSGIGVFDNGVLDGAATMRYIFQVFYDGNESQAERMVKYSDGKSVAFDVRLVPDREYKFVVWADVVTAENAGDNHYNTTDLENITLNGEWNAMDETRDAFTTTATRIYNGSMDLTLKLTRPFAKIRVVTTDIQNLLDLGIKPAKATVTYTADTKHRVAFNAVEGKAAAGSENKTHTKYTIAEYTNEWENGESEGAMTLYADYIFAENDIVKFDFDVYDEDNNLIKSNPFKTDINVKRNYLTTIKGNILTDGKNFTVTVEEEFAGENGIEDGKTFAKVDTVEELLEAINKGVEKITLEGDIDLNDLLTAGTLSTRADDTKNLVIEKELTIDFAGYTITGAVERKSGVIENKGTLTVKNGTIKSTLENGGSAIWNYGTLTMTDMTIIGAPSNIATSTAAYAVNNEGVGSATVLNNVNVSGRGAIGATKGAKVEINGGTYHTPAVAWGHAVYADGEGTEVVVNGGTFSEGYEYKNDNWGMYQIYSGNKAKVIVKGGDFSQTWDCANGYDLCTASEGTIEIYGGTFAENPSSQNGIDYVVKGYKAEEENGVYVVRKPQALIDFENAIANGNDVTLSEDLTLIDPVTVPEGKEVTINLNGKTLDIYTHKNVGPVLENNGTLAIEGGVISSNGDNGGSAIMNNGTLTVKNATLNGAPNAADGGWPSYTVNNTGTMTLENSTITSKHGSVASYGEGAVLTLNNCTIDMAGIPGFTSHGIYTYSGGKVIVNGGTYENKATDQNGTGASVINGNVEVNAGTFTGRIENYYGTPVLKGGTYSVKPNNAFVAEGYKVVQSGDKYMVVKEDVGGVATDNATLDTAINNAQDGATIALNAGEYVIPDSAKGKTITFIGTGNPEDTIIAAQDDGGAEGDCDYSLDGATVTFENVTITTTSTYFPGYARCKGTYKNCIINGVFTLYDSSSFEDCTFNVSGDLYNVWTWGAPTATFTRCTFNCDGKALLLYGTVNTKLTMNNCVFNDNGDDTVTGKAAIEIGNDYNKSYELTVNNATVNGFAINPNGIVTGTTLWANKNSMPADKLKVTVDGYTWVADGVTMNAEGEYLITKAAGLTWFSDQMNNKKNTFTGKTIKVVNDIDMAGVTYYGGSINSYPSYCFKGTFDGGEKVISNLTITVEDDIYGAAALIPSLAGDGTTIKNVILRDVNISSSHYAAGIWGYTTSENCWINVTNCHVEGGTITGNICNGDNADKVGGIGGIFYDGIVSGCSVKDVTISAYRDAAGIVGWAADSRANIKNNSIENVTINVNNATNYKNYTKRSDYDVNNYVGEGVGTAKLEGNTGEATINWGSITE